MMKKIPLIFFLAVLLLVSFSFYTYGGTPGDEEGDFMVTGHLYDLHKVVGVKHAFLEKAIPFINSHTFDFLVLTGDIVFAVPNQGPRPVATIKRQYDYVTGEVFSRINTDIHCVAGNHDTGKVRYPPAVKLFEKNFNPLSFSFEHKGSLFLFLSIYQPFQHMESGGVLDRLPRLWRDYDTSASRRLLQDIQSTVQGSSYDHIFIFAHFSPLNDFGIGYYWSQFLIPYLSTLKQDVHVFSTSQLTKPSLMLRANQVVTHGNISFYCFAEFPTGCYSIHYDSRSVGVHLFRGSTFVPAVLKKTDFHPATRLTMVKSFIYSWFIFYPRVIIKTCWHRWYNRIRKLITGWWARLFP